MAGFNLMGGKGASALEAHKRISDAVKNQSSSLVDRALNSVPAPSPNVIGNNIVGDIVGMVGNAASNPEGFKNQFESNARDTFAKKQQRDLDSMRNLTAYDALSAFKGANYVNPGTVASIVDKSKSIDKPSSFIRDLYNRSQTGLELPDIINFTSQHKTPTEYRVLWDAYHAANKQDAKPAKVNDDDIAFADKIDNEYLAKYMPAFSDMADTGNPALISAASTAYGSPIKGLSEWYRTPVVDPSRGDYDDGSPGSWESDMLKGDEYLRQREYGLPGRPVKDIHPDWYYNKYDEMLDHGYVPYIVTDEGLDRFHNNASINAISNIYNNIRDARKILSDATATLDGRTYSMKDVVKNFQIQGDKIERQFDNMDNVTAEPIDDMSIPMTALRQDDNGVAHYIRAMNENDDGSFNVLYDDMMKQYDSFESFSDDVSMGMQQLYPGSAILQYSNGIDPIELDDGTLLRYDKACAIVSEKVPIDKGFLNMGDPFQSELLDDFPNNVVNFSPWFTDMLGSSIPLFNRNTAWTQAFGDAWNSWRGFQPGRYDYLDNSYRMLSETPSHTQQLSAVGGSLALPWTERIYGSIRQGGLTNPTLKMLGRIGDKLGRNWPSKIEMVKPKKRFILGGVGEALEEIPGNIVEEFKTGNGPGAWYADDIVDSNGNKIYDNQGMPIKDKTTPPEKVHQNFWEDAPNSALGGAFMGWGLGPFKYNSHKREYALSHIADMLGSPSNFYSENVKNSIDNRTRDEAYSDNLSVPLPSYLTNRRRR